MTPAPDRNPARRGTARRLQALARLGWSLQEISNKPDRKTTRWGTVRRLHALARLGWSPEAISKATRIPLDRLSTPHNSNTDFWPALDQRIAVAYDRLQNRRPPQRTRRQQERARATRTEATQKWWPPPEAWPDNEIDHPFGQPRPEWIPDSGRKPTFDLDATGPEAEAERRLIIELLYEEEKTLGWEPGQ